MITEDDTVSTAVMAEDAAVRARNLILALHRHGDAFDIMAVADAVADGARRGVTTALSGQILTMSRADADKYATAAASGAAAAALAALANRLTGNVGPLCTSSVNEDEATVVAALTRARVGAQRTSSGNISLNRHFILAFSAMMATVYVFAIILRAV